MLDEKSLTFSNALAWGAHRRLTRDVYDYAYGCGRRYIISILRNVGRSRRREVGVKCLFHELKFNYCA